MADGQVLDTPGGPFPRFRLRHGPIFWRVAIVALIALEAALWLHLRPIIPFRPRYVRIVMMLWWAPRFVVYAGALGAAVAVVADLVFRLVVRPLMVRWYNPRPRDAHHVHALPFFAKAGEVVLDEVPARRVCGHRREPGDLVLTNHGLYFYPHAWDAEPWMLPAGHLEAIATATPRRRVLNWVRGYPDNVVVHEDSGETTAFVVAEPERVVAWGNSTVPSSPHFQNA